MNASQVREVRTMKDNSYNIDHLYLKWFKEFIHMRIGRVDFSLVSFYMNCKAFLHTYVYFFHCLCLWRFCNVVSNELK